MRVLVIADPYLPVPPPQYGGTERIVHLLCQELSRRGYIVDLLAAKGSKPYSGKLYAHKAPTLNYLSRAYRKILFQLLLVRASLRADIVITFGRPDYLWALFKTKKPLVIRFANPLDQHQIDEILAVRNDRLEFIGVSHDHVAGLEPAAKFSVVYNATEVNRFPFKIEADDPHYLAFLGRLTRNKGVHLAIQAAKAAKMRLVIAGNLSESEPGALQYFREQIEPELNDQIQYIGPVDDAAKGKLLSGAAAMLFPIQWREPFGIVMLESLACGCPVIAWRNGSVPEVIRDGVTGYIVESLDEMVAAIGKLSPLNRLACRREVEARFSPEALADCDVHVFRKAMDG